MKFWEESAWKHSWYNIYIYFWANLKLCLLLFKNSFTNIKTEVKATDKIQALSIANLHRFISSKSYEKVSSHINIDIVNPIPAINETKNTE